MSDFRSPRGFLAHFVSFYLIRENLFLSLNVWNTNDLSECVLPEQPQFFWLNLGQRSDPSRCKSFESDNKYVPANISAGLSLFHSPKGFKNTLETQNTIGQMFQKKALNNLFSLFVFDVFHLKSTSHPRST